MGAYLVTTYDAVWDAYRDARFSTRGYQATLETIHGRTVLSMEGSLHAKNRALLTRTSAARRSTRSTTRSTRRPRGCCRRSCRAARRH